MTTPEQEQEPQEPQVTDVPEPDQEPHEPVPDEADEEGEHEAETVQPEPAAPQNEKEIEKAAKALVKLAQTNANRIGQIMGEDAQNLEPCPRCMGGDPAMPKTPGFVWPVNLVPLLPEHKAAVKRSIGEGAEPEFRENDDARPCPKCNGEGKYLTGSKVPAHRTIACDTCGARGWVGQRALSAPVPTSNGAVEPVPVGVGAEETPSGADPWGRLPDDPNFGVLPGFTR